MDGDDHRTNGTDLIGSSKQDETSNSQSTVRVSMGLPETDTLNQTLPVVISERFVLERELGQGGFGITYLARDLSDDGRAVAVKVLLGQTNSKMRDWVEGHFRAEVEALRRIDHPGVVKLIDSGLMQNGKAYIAMEYVEGRSLRLLIEPEEGVGDFGRAARIIRQLGEAIGAAHKKGIYHRDLKPENILLARAGDEEQVKVIDFGLATVKDTLDATTRATVLAGSIRYMAPEQLQGHPSASSDVYTLGIIAYEMITGRVPFNPGSGSTVAAMTRLDKMQRAGVRVKPADLRPALPTKAQGIILRALEYDPDKRFELAEDFSSKLAAALAEAPGQPTRVSRVPAMARIAVAVAVLLMIAGVVWFIERRGGDELRSTVSAPAPQIRTLSYWGELQPYKERRPSGSRLRLTGGIAGETFFNPGDGLTFYFTASSDGFLYLLYEEDRDSRSDYSLLFPSPRASNTSSEVKAGLTAATSENMFDAESGIDKVWIVWSAQRIGELEEAIRLWANETEQGRIKDAVQAAAIRELLDANVGNSRAEADVGNERINLRTPGETVVYLLSLKHR